MLIQQRLGRGSTEALVTTQAIVSNDIGAPGVPVSAIFDRQAVPVLENVECGEDMAISVVVPTYNERENIPILVDMIARALRDREFEVIVVDDDSPDLTWARVDELGESLPWLRCHRRVGKRGLSSAVVDGLLLARGTALVVMDADLQHDPATIPALVAGLATAELSVASRYISGGGTGQWGKARLAMSRTATWMARKFLGTVTTDVMSGFFAVRRSFIRRVAPRLDPRGYKILMELLHRGDVQRVVDVPYRFGLRVHGNSKISTGIAWDCLASMWDLRFGSVFPVRFIKYCLVGMSGVGVQLLATHCFRQIPQLRTEDSTIATALALACAMVSNYLLDNRWAFRDVRYRGAAAWLAGLARFSLICGVGAMIGWLVMLGVRHASDMRMNVYFGQLCGIAVSTIWNYAVNRRFTWKVPD